MCLVTVEQLGKREKKSGTGYKVYEYHGRRYYTPYYFSIHKTEEWSVDKEDRKIFAENGKTYKAGYHLFLNRKDAIDYALNFDVAVVKEVEYTNAVAKGEQEIGICNYAPCVVAKRIRIRRKRIRIRRTKR